MSFKIKSGTGSTLDIVNEDKINEDRVYREAFDDFDWNNSGTIPNSVGLLMIYYNGYK